MKLYDLSLEQAVLGSCILEPKYLSELCAYDDTHFYTSLSKRLFSIMSDLHNSDTRVDSTIILSKVENDDELKVFITACVDSVITTENFEYYLKLLIEYKIRRDIKSLGVITQNLDLTDLPTAIETLNQKISEIQPQKIEQTQKEKYDEILDEYYDLKERGNEMPSGFPSLDKLINGFRRRRVYVLGGESGSGKTGLALFLAQRIALEKKMKVLFFSLEMSAFEIVGRLASIINGVQSHKVQQPYFMNKEDMLKLTDTCSKLYKSTLEIVDGVWNINDIIGKIKKSKPDLVVIDHLQFVQIKTDKYDKQHEQLAGNIKNLKNIAKTEGISVLAVSHNRRPPAGASNHEKNTDYKGSADIKEITDIGFMLVRTENKKETILAKPDGYAELLIIKNRHGKRGKINLMFNDDNLHFSECAFQEE